MPCFHPLDAFISRRPDPDTGKRKVLFDHSKARDFDAIKLPCGQCHGCRMQRASNWAVRCVHEASLYKSNCFITLTYNDLWLPDDRSLHVKHFQDFMKRLRKRFSGVSDVVCDKTGEITRPIRFYHCGEYGENFGRPHYHSLLFNFDFPDKYVWRNNRNGHMIWRSPALEQLWPFGLSEIGSITFESAAYVARYIMKKITGDAANDHYHWVDPSTGQILYRKPEYVTMSRRPGIAYRWFKKFQSDVFPHDHVVINGVQRKPPRYYDNLFEIHDPSSMELIKFERWKSAIANIDDNTPERLLVKEQVFLARTKSLKRSLT